MDGDWSKTFYPENEWGTMGTLCCGPDDLGHGLNWWIPDSYAGEAYEIVFIAASTDPKKKILWRRVEEQDETAAIQDLQSAIQ